MVCNSGACVPPLQLLDRMRQKQKKSIIYFSDSTQQNEETDTNNACHLAGEEPRATTTPSPAPNPPAPTQTTTTRPSFKRELVPSHAAAAAAVATSAKPAAGIGAFVGAAPGELWTAKVMLMGGFAHSTLHAETARQFKHQLDLPFLVRKRAKGELQLLGGSWTPQDGGHPEKDPGALIRTAIRTVKEQCGANCTFCTHIHAWDACIVYIYFSRTLRVMMPCDYN